MVRVISSASSRSAVVVLVAHNYLLSELQVLERVCVRTCVSFLSSFNSACCSLPKTRKGTKSIRL